MNIQLFAKPEKHPFGMLSQYDDANQKESLLAWMLSQCIKAGEFVPIETKYDHSDMVKDGLLHCVSGNVYELTTKSIGLLYSAYGREAYDAAQIALDTATNKEFEMSEEFKMFIKNLPGADGWWKTAGEEGFIEVGQKMLDKGFSEEEAMKILEIGYDAVSSEYGA